MESWVSKLDTVIGRPEVMSASDWLKLEMALSSWQTLAEKALQNISSMQTENEKDDTKYVFLFRHLLSRFGVTNSMYRLSTITIIYTNQFLLKVGKKKSPLFIKISVVKLVESFECSSVQESLYSVFRICIFKYEYISFKKAFQ